MKNSVRNETKLQAKLNCMNEAINSLKSNKENTLKNEIDTLKSAFDTLSGMLLKEFEALKEDLHKTKHTKLQVQQELDCLHRKDQKTNSEIWDLKEEISEKSNAMLKKFQELRSEFKDLKAKQSFLMNENKQIKKEIQKIDSDRSTDQELAQELVQNLKHKFSVLDEKSNELHKDLEYFSKDYYKRLNTIDHYLSISVEEAREKYLEMHDETQRLKELLNQSTSHKPFETYYESLCSELESLQEQLKQESYYFESKSKHFSSNLEILSWKIESLTERVCEVENKKTTGNIFNKFESLKRTAQPLDSV